MSRVVAAALALGLVYALTLASADPLDLLTGAVLGGVLVVVLGRRLQPAATERTPVPPATRVLWFPVFAAAVVADVVQGTWDVALRVLSVRPLEAPGVVRVPIGDRSDRGAAVTGLASSLSPGSVLVDIDWERRDLLFHVIDASDPDGLRARQQRFYDRYQRRVFP